MGFLKRITELLTPPPRKVPGPVRRPSRSVDDEFEAEASERLGVELKRLTSSALPPDATNEAMAELKKLAAQIGPYVVASKMRFLLDAMRPVPDEPPPTKERGYVLAADFIFQHINKEVHAIEHEGRTVGPNIFRGYCNELVACLVQGKNVRRSIEVPVLLIDNLLERGLLSARFRNVFFDMADQAGQSALAQAVTKYEFDEHERARRRLEEKRGDSSISGPEDPSTVLDAKTVGYIKDLHAAVDQFIKSTRETPPAPAPAPGSTTSDPLFVARSVAYLQSVLGAAESCPYRGPLAIVSQRLASALEPTNAGAAAAHLRQAAEANEAQADVERPLYLYKLTRRRYKLAYDAYAKLGDEARLAALQEKLKD